MGPGHSFLPAAERIPDAEKFDAFAERECAPFYAEKNGRPSLTPEPISGC